MLRHIETDTKYHIFQIWVRLSLRFNCLSYFHAAIMTLLDPLTWSHQDMKSDPHIF